MEVKVKKDRADLVFSLQILVEYHTDSIKEDHWGYIYSILDILLLDEIFQEKDALNQCSNLH